jgi:fumarate reductase subunit C
LSKGQEAFDSFLAAIKGPWGFLGLAVILAFAVHNATNWFNVTPKAMPVQIGEEFLDGKYIVGAHYAVWIVATLVVLFFAGVL